MQVQDAIEQYQIAILVHSQQTQTWYMSRLRQFIAWCEDTSQHIDKEHTEGRVLSLEDITVSELGKYIHYLSTRLNVSNGKTGKPLSSYTVHGHARIIRTFLNWCTGEDKLEELVQEKTPQRMRMPKIIKKIIETYTTDQLSALFTACDNEARLAWAVRDKAILSVLIDTGIRANELCTLTLDNAHLDPQDAYLTVFGKGGKWREVGLGNAARLALEEYISKYRKAPAEETHVFLSRFTKPFTVNGLDQVIYRLGKWASVKGVRVSAHTFRHTYACEYLKNGGDVYKLSRVLGHESVQITTDVYLKAFRARDARQNSASVLDALRRPATK